VKKKQHLRLEYLSRGRQFKAKLRLVVDFNYRHGIDFNNQDLVSRVFVREDEQDAGFYSLRVNYSKNSSRARRVSASAGSSSSSGGGLNAKKIKQRVLRICYLTNFQSKNNLYKIAKKKSRQ
jgi:hypothetical protein